MTAWTPAQSLAMELRGRDILVSAAAGSGKTATLTERIIRSLTVPDKDGKRGDISRMLIVTFTRTAAAELRSRISRALSDAIAAHPDDKYLYHQLVALGSAHISTIDSFYLEPVRANFERLGLPSAFRLADKAELLPLELQTISRLITECYGTVAVDPDSPLAALENNAFAAALDDIMPNRDDGGTPELLLKLYEKLITQPEGVELIRLGAERLEAQAELPFSQTREGQLLSSQLADRLASHASFLQRACELLRCEELLVKKYLPSFAHDLDTVESALADLRAGLWESAGKRLTEYAPIALSSAPGAAALLPEVEELKAIRSEITTDLRGMAKRYFAESAGEISQEMRHTAATARALYTLLSAYDKEILAEKIRRGILDFSDVRRFLLDLLVDADGQPTDIAHDLSERFDAVYIDEYQDVDAVQDRIFATIGEGGKRFMVGDIKQSIFSFRGAEPSIFSGYRRAFPLCTPESPDAIAQGGSCVFMSENFRCDRSVIDFTNTVCGYTFSGCPDSMNYQQEDELVCSKLPEAQNRPSVPVRVVLLDNPRKKDGENAQGTPERKINSEAAYIADEIARLLRQERRADGKPFSPRDVAILLRKDTMAGDLVYALHAHGIETTFAARDRIATHPDMVFMVNLLSVIDNPRDDVPLMGLLSAPDSPFSLSDLLSVREGAPSSVALFDAICAAAEEKPLDGENTQPGTAYPPALSEHCRAFLAFLSHWRTLSASLPIDRLLRKLYSEPFLLPKASSPALLSLYDLARNYQNNSFCGLYQFLQYLRQLLSDPDALPSGGLKRNEDAVEILTVHKSKGLEYPVVFVAGCASPFNAQDQTSPLMFDRDFGVAAPIFCPEDSSHKETVTRRAIAALIRERQTEEEMRILYVALTRARERLYLTARPSARVTNLFTQLNRQTRGDRPTILGYDCYIKWVLAALSPENRLVEPDFYGIDVLNAEDYLVPHPVAQMADVPRLSDSGLPAESASAAFCRRVAQEHETYRDPNATLRLLPTKAAASKLRAALLDGIWDAEEIDSDQPSGAFSPDAMLSPELIRRRIALMQSAVLPFNELLEADRRATPAERGSATHLFLQYCDYGRLSSGGVRAEIDRLVKGKFIPRRAAEILSVRQLEMFLKSDLFRAIRDAKSVRRELHFDRFIPYRALTANGDLAGKLGDCTLYVQGSIDLLLENSDGSLWLYDYKTDRLSDEDGTLSPAEIRERLLAAHADQLRIYSDAATDLFHRRPDRVLIYSLPLGASVDLTDDLSRPL